MQRLIQRTAAAQRQAARRAARLAGKADNEKEFNIRQQQKVQRTTAHSYIQKERERRREIYESGPLAPKYDVGESGATYGTVDPYIMQGVARAWRQYKDEVYPVAEGDRVVITEGKDKGRIGRIIVLNKEGGFVKVDGLNQGDYHVPEYARMEDSDPRTIVPTPLPIPLKNVRLVHALRDPETGTFQDTILDKVDVRGAGWNKTTREYHRGMRYVPGLGEPISWPKTVEETEPTTHDDDTYRINVDEKSDRPYLLQPPMPPSVIDELRNKYSVFRVRHEEWYEARKLAEDRAEQYKKNLAKMVSTPTMELSERRRQEKLETETELTEEQLAKIGQVMAEEKLKAARKVAQRQQ